MLKPIHRLNCSPALAACQRLMQRFALWLCDANVHGTGITKANLQAQMPSAIEGEWLWTLIAVDKRSTQRTKKLLASAKAVADLPLNEKQALTQWVQAVANLAQHFTPAPPAALPVEPPNGWRKQGTEWTAFNALMVAFYEEGLKDGLPYQSNGTPTNNPALQVTYDKFKREFRQAHRTDPDPYAREVCVLCGGELKLPAVDHWVGKGAFPLLAVCADNLLPICGECNEAPQKGQKPVHTTGGFEYWFHPYLRHANGTIRLRFEPAEFALQVESRLPDPNSQRRTHNIDNLLNLAERCTREFKAEYRRIQRDIDPVGRHRRGLPAMDNAQLMQTLTNYRNSLSAVEPNHETHRVVADVLLDPARVQALLS